MDIAININNCEINTTINVSDCKIYKNIKDVSHIGVQADDVQDTTGAESRVYPSAENRSQIYEDLEDNAANILETKFNLTKSKNNSKSIELLGTQPNEKEKVKAAPIQKFKMLVNDRNRQCIKRCESDIELCKKVQEHLNSLTKPVKKAVKAAKSKEPSEVKKRLRSARQSQEATWDENLIRISSPESLQEDNLISARQTQEATSDENETISSQESLQQLQSARQTQEATSDENETISSQESLQQLQSARQTQKATSDENETISSQESLQQLQSARQTQEAIWDENQTVIKCYPYKPPKYCLESNTKHQNVESQWMKAKSAMTISNGQNQADAPRLKNETRHWSLPDIPVLDKFLEARRKRRQDPKSRHSVDHKCHKVDKATQTHQPLARRPSSRVDMILHTELIPRITMPFDDGQRRGRKTAQALEKERNRLRARLYSQIIAQRARIGRVNYTLSTLLL